MKLYVETSPNGKMGIPLGKGINGSVPVWLIVPEHMVEKDEAGPSYLPSGFITTPIINYDIKELSKYHSGSLLTLVPEKGRWVDVFELKPGYRETAEFTVSGNNVVIYDYVIYKSQTSSLGIGRGMVFSAPLGSRVRINWHKADKDKTYSKRGALTLHS